MLIFCVNFVKYLFYKVYNRSFLKLLLFSSFNVPIWTFVFFRGCVIVGLKQVEIGKGACDMDDFIQDKKEQFIDKIAENMHAFGISETVGRVLGTIYMNREPMTLDELSEATGMSKMRMSQVVREMVELGIADKVRRKGDRKDYIQVENDYYQTFISLFTSNWQSEVRKSRAFGQRFTKDINQTEVSTSSLQEKEELAQEMEEWQNYYEWIDRVVEFFESEEIFKYVPKKEGENIDGK